MTDKSGRSPVLTDAALDAMLADMQALLDGVKRVLAERDAAVAAERARIVHFLRNQWAFDGEVSSNAAHGLAEIIETNTCAEWLDRD